MTSNTGNLIAAGAVMLFAICNSALAAEPETGIGAVAGHWTGHWKSENTGHRGVLRADFRKCCEGSCDVVFSGRFCAVIPFRYRMQLQAEQQEDGSVHLSGSRRLGLLLGTFDFEGEIRHGQLNAQFSAADDNGTFELSKSAAESHGWRLFRN